MYDRRIEIDGEPTSLLFGNTSALYESDMVMVDRQTGSYWMQVSGMSLVGTLSGRQLTALPSQTTTWRLWWEQHPHTLVLSTETGFDRNYLYDPFLGLGEQLNETGRFIFPVSETGLDPRLDPGEVVLGVEFDGEQWAYPIARIGSGVIVDKIGPNRSEQIVLFILEEGPTAVAFFPELDGRLLTFEFGEEGFVDQQTGSTWSMSGEATTGPLKGSRLTPLPTRSTYWFSLISSFPDLHFYQLD